jgi:hypothetical protein
MSLPLFAMANLATATSADRETVATLTRAITTLTDQLKAKDTWAKSQEAEVRRLLGVQGHPQGHPQLQARQQPTSENPTGPTMIITVGPMDIKLD